MAGILRFVQTAKKVTVQIPGDLLRKAQRATGQGITPTIRQGLELVAAVRVYEVKFSIGNL